MSIWTILILALVLGIVMQIAPLMVWAERKVSARIQNRRGPNLIGPFGLLQPIADAIKLLTKEDTRPEGAEKWLFILAPLFAFVPPAIAMAVIPIGHPVEIFGTVYPMQAADLNVGIIFILALTSLAVYSLAFAGWSSNSKYPLLSSVRASAQTISYEIAMGLAVIAVVMVSGSVSMNEIVMQQQGTIGGVLPNWNIFNQPLAALIFLVSAFAENNRLPFDMAECEPELVGGFHTEYSGMKFGMFFLGEYVAMIVMSAAMVTLFFGGWGLPGVIDPHSTTLGSAVLSLCVFLGKLFAVLFFYIWVRWTLPRFRYDQLMNLGWKALIPLGLANIVLTGLWGIL
ncbi:MAG: NADH-quinone oxidoreductase subunit NuoH [Planctomycetota bacterium]|jgi:NADH-quinone oxidoreductase subunit H